MVFTFQFGVLRALFGGAKPTKAPPWRRDWSQACSRSPTSAENCHNYGRNCLQHSTNRRGYYCVTHGHGLSYWN